MSSVIKLQIQHTGMEIKMLVEKYRPKSLDDIIGHKKHVAMLKGFVEKGELPNLCFYGKSGNGKTAVAHALAYELGCMPEGFMELNASDERGIGTVRDKIKSFAKTMIITGSGLKICLLDEADELTKQAQQALRRVMEAYYKSGVRFILIANEKGKLSTAITSRSPPWLFRALHPSHMRSILVRVQSGEGRIFKSEVNDALIDVSSGDARMMINLYEALIANPEDPTKEDVYEIIGVVDDDNVFKMMHGALKGDIRSLDVMQGLLKTGSAHELMNTMYWMAYRGGRGMTTQKRLRVLRALGVIPGQTDEFRLTGVLAQLIEWEIDESE